MSKGELIWIAESDDSCDNRLIEELVNCFMNNPDVVLAFSRSVVIDEKSHLKKVWHTQVGNNYAFMMDGLNFIKYHLKRNNDIANASAAVFRKSVLKNIPKDYMEYNGCGDWLFWIYVCEQGKVCYSPYLMNYFRHHGSNTTSHQDMNGNNDHEILSIIRYLEEMGLCRKRDLVFIKLHRLEFHERWCKFENEKAEQQFKKEWGITPMTYLFWYIQKMIGTFHSQTGRFLW